MAINVIGGGPNGVMALESVPFVEIGINAANTTIIFKVLPGLGYISFKPSRSINGITGFEDSSVYLINAKQDMDLSLYVIPPKHNCPPPGIPEITTTIADTLSLQEGDTLLFHIVVAGVAPIEIQWMKDGAALTGENSPDYTIANVTTEDAGAYQCLCSNTLGGANTNVCTVTVNP